MSSIPYNYGKYIDDTQKLRDQGHVDAGKQVQSPASAGSRGLNKTVQFTKDPTQMKMGESITMEDMKSLISRIDGLNVPTNEAPKDSDIDYAKLMLQISAMKDKIAELPIDDDRKTSALTALGQVEDDLAMDESAVREDDRVEKAMKDTQPSKVTGYYEITDFWKEHTQMWGKDPETVKYEIADWMVDEMKPDNTPEREELTKRAWAIVDDALKNNKDDMTFDDMIDQLKGKSEDTDELSRLKELSGIQEDAGLTDEQKKGLEAIAKKYKGREGYNGDFLPIGYIKAIMSTGVGTDGMDGEEVEAFAKKLGKDVSDIEDEWEDFETLDNITNAMKGDINDVLGNGWDVNQELASAAKDYLYDLDESYEPFPEADEMTFEDDDEFFEAFGYLGFPEDETELFDAEYRGRKVPLNKPMRGDVKKFKVYVKDPKSGNVKKVNFGHGGSSARKAGQKTMKIRKSNPKARKSFRARHNCANPGPKTKARYWSCRKW